MKYILGKSDGMLELRKLPHIEREYETFGMCLALEEEMAGQFAEADYWIEPDYEMCVDKIHLPIEDILLRIDSKVMFVTIGTYEEDSRISHYYELTEGTWQVNENRVTNKPWICCYSKAPVFPVSCLLNAVDVLHQMAQMLQLHLGMVGHLTARLPYFKHRSLAQFIMNRYLKKYQSVFWIEDDEEKAHLYTRKSQRKYEPYNNQILYGKGCKECFLRKIDLLSMGKSISKEEGPQGLYKDYFYNRIPLQEKIYVPLKFFNHKDASYYETLGLQTIKLMNHYPLLYDEREKIDAVSKELRGQVLPNFNVSIACPIQLKQKRISGISSYKQVKEELRYKGSKVYIGVIGTQGVNYEVDFLRDATGATRMAYIWEQESGDAGKIYDAAQINTWLGQEGLQTKEDVKQKLTQETLMLEIASGKNSTYQGIATEAEFIAAKINVAPVVLTQIYGGLASKQGVLLPDVLAAMSQMITLAKADQRPLVILMPYQSNLSAHDGSGIYEQLLEQMAREEGVCVVIPTGEEGNKAHHMAFMHNEEAIEEVFLLVKEETQQLVGKLYSYGHKKQPVFLECQQGGFPPIRLDEKGQSKRGVTTVYSTGIEEDYQNGSYYILFSLEHVQMGEWRLHLEKQENETGLMELWLAQEMVNPYVTLRPSCPFITLGSSAAVAGVMTVGAFNMKDLAMFGASGRGYTADGIIKPSCVSQGETIVRDEEGWRKVQGTAVAASIMVGVIATVYNRWTIERGEPYPNTLLIKQLVLSHLTKLEGEQYPSRGQGYGVFKLDNLPELLEKTMS